MPGIGEIFSFSGILKVLEILLGFITIIIHRYGDYGKMIFFGSVEDQLQQVGVLTEKNFSVSKIGGYLGFVQIMPILNFALEW